MPEPRVIKKYPNRRLYDTTISSYITLADVKQLVMDGVEFQVVDARSGEDLTRSILLQIIAEQEEGGAPIFSSELLTKIIRFYGDSLQSVMSSYLNRSMEAFIEQQGQLRTQMQEMMTKTPIALMNDMAETNLALWRNLQENLFRGTAEHSDQATPDETAGKPEKDGGG